MPCQDSTGSGLFTLKCKSCLYYLNLTWIMLHRKCRVSVACHKTPCSTGLGILEWLFRPLIAVIFRNVGNLTVDFLQHDGVQEVSGCHVGLLFVHHGGELVEANLSGWQLWSRSFLEQRGEEIFETIKTLEKPRVAWRKTKSARGAVPRSDRWGAFAADKPPGSACTPFP